MITSTNLNGISNAITILSKANTGSSAATSSLVVSTSSKAAAQTDPLTSIREILAKSLVSQAPSTQSASASLQTASTDSSIFPAQWMSEQEAMKVYKPDSTEDHSTPWGVSMQRLSGLESISFEQMKEDQYKQLTTSITVTRYDEGVSPPPVVTTTQAELAAERMEPQRAAAFLAAVANKTLTFTSTSDVPGLDFHMNVSYSIDSAGNYRGGSIDGVSYQGAVLMDKFGQNYSLLTAPTGYRENGKSPGIIMSW